jgi:hypothetical protein
LEITNLNRRVGRLIVRTNPLFPLLSLVAASRRRGLLETITMETGMKQLGLIPSDILTVQQVSVNALALNAMSPMARVRRTRHAG